MSLGTDGFGRSEGRPSLRDFFEVDARFIVCPRFTNCCAKARLRLPWLKKPSRTYRQEGKLARRSSSFGGLRKEAHSSSHRTENVGKMGHQRATLCRLGDLSPQRFTSQSESPLAASQLEWSGLAKFFSAPTTEGKRGKPPGGEERLPRPALNSAGSATAGSWRHVGEQPVSLCHALAMTARNIRGNSSAYGISNRRSPILTRSMPVLRMRRSFVRRTAPRPGRNCRRCAVTALVPSGNRAQAACVCIRLFSIPPTRRKNVHLPFLRRRFPAGRRRQGLEADQSGTAFTIYSRPRSRGQALRSSHREFTPRVPMCCSCKTSGT